jgi:hypothetical protein
MRRIMVALIALSPGLPLLAGNAAAQDWQTLSQSRRYNHEKALKVDVGYAAGTLNIEAGSAALLYRAGLRYDADVFDDPEMSYENGALTIDLSDGHVKGHDLEAGRLNLALGTSVPLDIDLQFGAAEATIDLGGLMVQNASIQTGASRTMLRVSKPNRVPCRKLNLEVGAARLEAVGLGNLNLEQLEVSGGVGEITLDFSGSVKRNIDATVEMGLGSLTLRVPRGTGLKVTKDGLLASFDSQGMVKRGDSYYSENWGSAQSHVTVGIDAAFGSINVEWIDG